MLALLTTHEIKQLGESPVPEVIKDGKFGGSTTIRVGQFWGHAMLMVLCGLKEA